MAFGSVDPLLRQKLSGLGGASPGPNLGPLAARPPGLPPMSMSPLSMGRNLNRVPPVKIPFGPRMKPHIPGPPEKAGGFKIPRFGKF